MEANVTAKPALDSGTGTMIFKHFRLRIAHLFLAILLLTGLNPPMPANALSECQRKVIDSGISRFNCEQTTFVTACGGGALVGSDNAEKIWNYFRGQGFEPWQAAGIMGNMMAESKLNPRSIEPYPKEGDYPVRGKGFGLVQWTFAERQVPLEDKAEAAGVLPSDLNIQLQYVIQELEGNRSFYRYDEFRASTTVEQATEIILTRYERPANISAQRPIRLGFARDFETQFGSSSGGSESSSGTIVCSGSGGVVNGYSLPVDRRWYDSNPEWFTKPHHDYPASDIPVPTGSKVYSMTDGTVIKAPTTGGCGTGIIIDDPNGVRYTYCHGTDGGAVSGARTGDTVTAGQYIMSSGNTGDSTGPHLHLQITVGGQNRCPQTLFTGIAEGTPPDVNTLPSGGCTN
jgi:murein DD-endopeptidase MepM/ murein hydrolase activator NlpD